MGWVVAMSGRRSRLRTLIESASPELFDPHLGRFIAKVRSMF